MVSSDLAGLFYSCTSKLIRVCWPLVNIQVNKINFDCLESTLSPGEVDADSPGVILQTDFSPACFLSLWPALEADLGISQKIKDFSKPAKSGAAGARRCKINHGTHSESRKQCPKMPGKSGISTWDGTGSCCSCLSANFSFFRAIFSVRRWARCFFFSQLFLSTSFVNEQEGGGFMWMKSSWVELGFSWQLFQDLACVITSEKKTISSRRILRLMSALAPVSWAVEVFLSFFGLFWVFVCMLFLLWTQPHCPCCCHGRGSHERERSSKLGCQGCFLYSAQEWKIQFF